MDKQQLLQIILLTDKQRSLLYELIDAEETIYAHETCPALFLLEDIEAHGEDEKNFKSIDFYLDNEWLDAVISYVKEYK